jgi:hypothetical protein
VSSSVASNPWFISLTCSRSLSLRLSAWEWPYFIELMIGSQLELQMAFLEHWTGDAITASTDSCLQKFRSIIDERIPSQYYQSTFFGDLPLTYPISIYRHMKILQHRWTSSHSGVNQSTDWWENGYDKPAGRVFLHRRVRSALVGTWWLKTLCKLPTIAYLPFYLSIYLSIYDFIVLYIQILHLYP